MDKKSTRNHKARGSKQRRSKPRVQFTGASSPKRHSRREGDESKKTHTQSQNKRNFSKFEYEEEEEQKQELRTNKYKRTKKKKIVEDLRDSLSSSSSSVIDEDYSLNIHTHDIYDDP